MSLVELTVAMGLMLAIVPIFMPLLLSATRTVGALGAQSEAVSQLRVAVAVIGRELRSGECISEPIPNGPAGSTLRFTTNANNMTYEVTYRLSGGELRRQVTGQSAQIVATDLIGPSVPFQQLFTPRRSVSITLIVQADPRHPRRDVTTVIAGRNAWRDC
jgi:hypothetical protein